MLKTNSKKARENIHVYTMEQFDPTGYDVNQNPETFEETAQIILDTFHDEKVKHDNRYKAGRISEYELFTDWCQGLPSILDTCYYYNRSAVDDLAKILEETDTEKARYSEPDAEKLLTHLIYRELKRGAGK